MTDQQKVDFPIASRPYVCSECHEGGIKLWRNSVIDRSSVVLWCGPCALGKLGIDGTIDNHGNLNGSDQLYRRESGYGSRLPAVPAQGGTSFWGYSSVPEDRVGWWRRLPLRNLERVEVSISREEAQEVLSDYRQLYSTTQLGTFQMEDTSRGVIRHASLNLQSYLESDEDCFTDETFWAMKLLCKLGLTVSKSQPQPEVEHVANQPQKEHDDKGDC